MARLTSEQQRFLNDQRVPLSRVFDATGMTQSQYTTAMKALEFDVAIGVKPCAKAGHTLRTRYGHCVQCGTHNLAFLKRYDDPGDVYVASSSSTGLVKIGTSKSASQRISMLSGEGYGGGSDWSLRFHSYCQRAGRVEFIAQRKLQHIRRNASYLKAGFLVECQELFECPVDLAMVAVRSAMGEVGVFSPISEQSVLGTQRERSTTRGRRRSSSDYVRDGNSDAAVKQGYSAYPEVLRVPSRSGDGSKPAGDEGGSEARAKAQKYTVYKETVRIPSASTSSTGYPEQPRGQEASPQKYEVYKETVRVPKRMPHIKGR
jgi:hypothetical protein